MSTEAPSSSRSLPKPELTRREKLARRFAPLVLLVGATAVAGGLKLHDALEYDEIVGTETTQVGQNGTTTDTVKEAVREIAENKGIPLDKLSGEVAEAQEVAREIKRETGNSQVQPEDTVKVTITKNDFGRYHIEADPTTPEGE